jgi:GNAT superfamily N-acetyltransferase
VAGLLAARGPGGAVLTATAAQVELRRDAPGDLGWILERHEVLYAERNGWGRPFDALVARVLADFADQHDPACEALWIAWLDGERVGDVMCVREDERTAKLRILHVEPQARGHGIGTLLVRECLAFARQAGYERMILWTNSTLAPARRIYEREGFALESERPDPVFNTGELSQVWALEL